MSRLLVLVPDEAARRVREGGQWGQITFRTSDSDHVGAVVAVSHGTDPMIATELRPPNHFLRTGDSRGGHCWYRAAPMLHGLWWYARNMDCAVPLDMFKAHIAGRWSSPPVAGGYVALTVSPDAPKEFPDNSIADLVAWYVTRDAASPVEVDVVSTEHGFDQLAGHWPTAQLAEKSVMLVGMGSIGGAAAHALAGYGVGRIVLVDHDRLLSHNVVRHVSSAKQVGRLKVDAVKQELSEAWPSTYVEALPLNVVTSAHLIRPLLQQVDAVLCTADGVAARRVVSHLARRAQTDAVLACVLQDGAFGEVIRLRPWATDGCLNCRREALVRQGAMDPEPGLDQGYGTGTTHRPMTAVGGDLHLVAQLAAKATVATILERKGHSDQKLPGEHAILGLRPTRGWAPPFDLDHSGDIRWLPATPPLPGCPTCEEP
ncbi:ThiF family adenylyltransferase [Saccharothrix saharensis]|uniref:ThiF family adenylyltransferase n=1 Tax=Saccharothrix saharensis TaxID=571190 RepID=UPI0036A4A4CB